jgi:hypothetical protein
MPVPWPMPMVNHEPRKCRAGGTNLEGAGGIYIFSIIICIRIYISQASAKQVAAPDGVVNLKSPTLKPNTLATYYILYPKPKSYGPKS